MKIFKTIFKLTIFLLILNALYRFVPPYYRFSRFRAAAQDVAVGAKGKSDATIVGEVMDLAAQHKIPIEREWIEVRRSKDLTHTFIDATWAETVHFLPSWDYEWVFHVNVDGWHIKPVTAREVQ